MLQIFLLWIPMVFLAIANGVLRELTYGKVLPELRAHQVSCFTGIFLFWAYSWVVFRFFPLESLKHALWMGTIWLGLTITFEFLFGRFVANHSWKRLLNDYNLPAGRLWILVLVGVWAAPVAAFGWHGRF